MQGKIWTHQDTVYVVLMCELWGVFYMYRYDEYMCHIEV